MSDEVVNDSELYFSTYVVSGGAMRNFITECIQMHMKDNDGVVSRSHTFALGPEAYSDHDKLSTLMHSVISSMQEVNNCVCAIVSIGSMWIDEAKTCEYVLHVSSESPSDSAQRRYFMQARSVGFIKKQIVEFHTRMEARIDSKVAVDYDKLMSVTEPCHLQPLTL